MMPVKGNEEGGVLSRRTTSNCFAGIPIKKRRFPEFLPISPPREQSPGVKEPNLEVVKKEAPVDLFESGSGSGSGSKSPNNIVTDSQGNLENPSLIVKDQILMKEAESEVNNAIELSLGSKEKLLFVEEEDKFKEKDKQSEGTSSSRSRILPDEVDTSLLTLSLSGENPIIETTIPTTTTSANRSNWDLNMTMDAWENCSVKDVTDVSYGDVIKPPCLSLVKGKQQLADPLEKTLHLSLGTPSLGSNLQKLTMTTNVKPEPVDESIKLNSVIPFNSNSKGSLVKTEIFVDKNKVSKLVEATTRVKSEVACGVIINRSNQLQESCSSSSTNISMPLTPQQPVSSLIPNCSKLFNQCEHSLEEEPIASGDLIVQDSERRNELSSIAEGKINSSDGSDYEPGGDHCLSNQVEHCEFEDGELRESLLRSSLEDPSTCNNITEMATLPCDSKLNETNIETIIESKADQVIEDELLSSEKPEIEIEIAALEDSREKNVIEEGNNKKELSSNYDVTGEIVQGIGNVGNAESSLTKPEESVSGVGNRSRIIHLPRASNFPSPSRINRSIPGRQLSSRGGRERYTDMRGNRDEVYDDMANKFSRDRIQNRNSRGGGIIRGRGRGRGRGNGSFHSEWDPPEHDFGYRSFNNGNNYQFNRHKRDEFVDESGNRGLRKTFNEETYTPSSSFRHSRRISPDRLRNNNNNNNINNSNEKKFITESSAYNNNNTPHHRLQYEEVDGGQFMRGNRRRGFPRTKSPVNNNRSRTPPPRQWISPPITTTTSTRRFNNNVSDQTQHRSPTYRMRSPITGGRVCYNEESSSSSRRHVSPNYMSRPVSNGRLRQLNSSDRVFSVPRTNRRLEVVDQRKSSRNGGGGEDYFDGPNTRFHDFRGGESDERKKFGGGERRSPILSYRQTVNTYNNNNNNNNNDGGYSLNSEDQDKDVFERDFDDGVVKNQNRPLIAQRRHIRNIEEQQGGGGNGNYRQQNVQQQIWHDDSFVSDDSRLKRRRF